MSESVACCSEGPDRARDAREQALAQFHSIGEMVAALWNARKLDTSDAIEEAERCIHEDALSVECRGEWYEAGSDRGGANGPDEYRILLCTGGPAVRIVGKLDRWCQPASAALEYQDWGTPWTEWQSPKHAPGSVEGVLLDYARCFYFGQEG